MADFQSVCLERFFEGFCGHFHTSVMVRNGSSWMRVLTVFGPGDTLTDEKNGSFTTCQVEQKNIESFISSNAMYKISQKEHLPRPSSEELNNLSGERYGTKDLNLVDQKL